MKKNLLLISLMSVAGLNASETITPEMAELNTMAGFHEALNEFYGSEENIASFDGQKSFADLACAKGDTTFGKVAIRNLWISRNGYSRTGIVTAAVVVPTAIAYATYKLGLFGKVKKATKASYNWTMGKTKSGLRKLHILSKEVKKAPVKQAAPVRRRK
ncbi:MAG: hypothetical protein UR26_C0002G0038 [candidate division TM6 bacterium GW2011_GWF2_32_72]|nr:MAG: hypothetical protein UR26_C0002G0038 [candidate division TM6 bacterium GW2011_GWF2_32_72]